MTTLFTKHTRKTFFKRGGGECWKREGLRLKVSTNLNQGNGNNDILK